MSEEQKLTEQEMNRRNKLEKYMERGIDPFGQAYERTHFSTEIRALVAGKSHDEVLAMNLHVQLRVVSCLFVKWEKQVSSLFKI